MSFPVFIPQGKSHKDLFNILGKNVLICFVFQTFIKMTDVGLMYVRSWSKEQSAEQLAIVPAEHQRAIICRCC